jgi:hypothetical protein
VSLTDERALDDKTLIGENRESSTPVPVYALSSVADFATEALRTCLLGWGVKVAPDADLVLKGAIVTLFVTEGNTYVANARIRFRLENRAGESLWEGVATGDARRWGRSFSADNYNEEISDALKKAYADLLSNSSLQDAWAGRAKATAPVPERTSMSPAAMKEKILSLMKEGLGKEVVAAYVREHTISPKLTAAEIVEWKKAGIPEPVISAALSQK